MRTASQIALFAGVVLVVASTGCPRPTPKKRDGTTVTVDGDPPDFPGDFTPGDPLPAPPAPDPGQFGLAYLERVYPAIREPWTAFLEDARLRLPPDHALNQPTLETRVEIVVDAHGAVTRVSPLSSSGNRDFDQVATEIARDAGPLPAPPRELLSDDDHVYLTWLFARDRRQAGVATAELRRVEWPLERAVPKFIEAGNLGEAAARLARAAERGGIDPKGPEAAQLHELTSRLMVAVLREGLRSADPAIQRLAIDEIRGAAARGERGGLLPAARELRSIADGSVEIDLRAGALAALGAIGDRDAVPTIQSILERDQGANPALSGAAAGALVALGKGGEAARLITGWLGGDRSRLGGGLATLSHAAVPGTSAKIVQHVGHTDLGVRVAACGAAGVAAGDGKDATAWKGLRKGLDDRDASVRAACARGAAAAAAAGARNRASYWRLVALFKDRDNRVRAAAARAALRLEPGRAAKETAALAKEKDTHVLAAIAEGLAVASGQSPPKRLAALAGHADTGVRAAAVTSLASRSDAASRKLAAAMIVDPEVPVRLAAVEAIDDPAQLESLASDPEPAVAGAAQVRRILLAGRWGALPGAVAAVAAAPADSPTRVRIAGAWLRAR